MPITLVPEDGTARADANTFASDGEFVAYCSTRGLAPVSVDADTRAVALIQAADYLANEERYHWRGNRVKDDQALPWPRQGAIILYGSGTTLASNVIPTAIKNAQCQIAFRALSAAVQPDLERGGGIASVSAGPVSVSYREDAMRETLIQVAQGLLKPYLRRVIDLPLAPFVALDQRGYEDTANRDVPAVDNDGVLTGTE